MVSADEMATWEISHDRARAIRHSNAIRHGSQRENVGTAILQSTKHAKFTINMRPTKDHKIRTAWPGHTRLADEQ
jgi:hypothetical protein